MQEEENTEILNTPIIPTSIIIPESHKIFFEYTSNNYYDYSITLFKSLCSNSHSKNKTSLFFKCIKCFIKILYNSKNTNYFSNELDLLLLTCFFLSLKTNELKNKIPKIKNLKNILPSKFDNYDAKIIKTSEVICIKLLDYDINMTTPFDFLVNLTSDDKIILELSVKELEMIAKGEIQNFVLQKPMDLAKSIINRVKQNNNNNFHKRLGSNCSINNNNCLEKENQKNFQTLTAKKDKGGFNERSYRLLKKFSCGMNSASTNLFIDFDCFVKNKVSLDFDSQRLVERLNIKNKMMNKIENNKKNNKPMFENNIYKRKNYALQISNHFSKINKRSKDISCKNIGNDATYNIHY